MGKRGSIMASNKAYYWVALAVLVLGLNSEYQRGRMQPLHRLVSRSAATVNCLAMRAEQYVDLARVLVGGNPKAPAATEWAHAMPRESGEFSRMEAELANRQEEFARLGAERTKLVRLGRDMARHQAQFARIQAHRAQMVIRTENLRKSIASCRDGEIRVTINADGNDVPDTPETPDTF